MKKLFFFIIFALLGISSSPAYAESVSLGVYPPVTKIEANAPAEISSPLTIQNYTDNPVDLEIQIKPFIPSSRFDGQIELLPDETKTSQKYLNLLKAVSVTDANQAIQKVSLSPKQQKQLALNVSISKNDTPGDYYFSVIFKSVNTPSTLTNESAIITSIGTNVLLTVGKKDKPSGIIQDFSAPLFLFNGPVNINLLLENTSNNLFQVEGAIVIKNMFGQTIGAENLLPVSVLAHSSRFIPDSTSSSLTQIIWPEKTLFGMYNAHLKLALSPQGPLFERTIWFIVFPTKFLLIFCAIIFLGSLLINRIIARIKS